MTVISENTRKSLFITIVYFIAFSMLFNSGYETNDDAAIQMIARGNMTGAPNPFLIYVGVGIGKILQVLFTLSDNINWYRYMLFVIDFSSVFFIVRLLLRFKKSIYVLGMVCVFLILVTSVLVSLQFTSTSILLGGAAFLQIYHSYGESVSVKEFLIGCLLLSIGVLLRFDLLYVFVFIALPVLIYRKKTALHTLLLIGLIGFLFLGKSFEMNLYANETGYNFREFLYAQDVIFDNPTKDITESVKKMNWSPNDLELLKRWMFIDHYIFNQEKMVRFSQMVASTATKNLFMSRLIDLVYYKKDYFFILLFLCLVIGIKDKSVRKELFIHIASVLFLFILFAYGLRVQDRVVIPILIFSFIYLAYLFLFRDIKLGKILFFTGFIIMMNSAFWLYMKDRFFSDRNKSKSLELNGYLKVMEKYPDKLYIIADAIFPIEGSAGHMNFDAMHKMQLMGTGWSTFSPAYNERLRKLGTDNLMEVIPRKKNIVIISQDKEILEIMKRFYAEHYNLNVQYENVIDSARPFYSFRVIAENKIDGSDKLTDK